MERSYTIVSGKTEERRSLWRGGEGGDNVDPSVADREVGKRLSVEFAVGEEGGEEREEDGLRGGGGGGGRRGESAERCDWIGIGIGVHRVCGRKGESSGEPGEGRNGDSHWRIS